MKILISDDDPTLRMLMCMLLRNKLGYEVFETTDGLKAWQALDSGLDVDLCIVDMWMPAMKGVELVSKLRSDPRFKSQKVILCSSANDRNSILQAVSLGISGYLLKPFVSERFLEQVRKVCEGSQVPAVREALEPIEAVLGRLGVGLETYLELLNVFTEDVACLIQELQNQPANESKSDVEIRLGGLCGAGRSLGTENLVAAITRLEKTYPAGMPSSIRSHIEALQKENERVISAIEVLSNQVEPSAN